MMLQAKCSLVDDKNNDFSVPETQGPEKGCVPVTICNKTSRSLMAQNNKHFIICTNSVGWRGSAGAILLFLMMWSGLQSSGTRLGCHTQAGALMAGNRVLVICWELSSWQEHLSFLCVGFLKHDKWAARRGEREDPQGPGLEVTQWLYHILLEWSTGPDQVHSGCIRISAEGPSLETSYPQMSRVETKVTFHSCVFAKLYLAFYVSHDWGWLQLD